MENQLTVVIGVPIKKESKEKAAEVIGLDLQSSKVMDILTSRISHQ